MKEKLFDVSSTLLPACMLVGVILEIHYQAEIYLVLITAMSFIGYLFEKLKPRG